jgi:DNA-binding GntR family transcriptional regulator
LKYNYQFHTGIYRLSRRPRLIRMIDSLWPLFPWDSMSTIPGRGPGIVEEHRAILAAVIDRDAAQAHQAMRFHMEAGAKALVALPRLPRSAAGVQSRSPVSEPAQFGASADSWQLSY